MAQDVHISGQLAIAPKQTERSDMDYTTHNALAGRVPSSLDLYRAALALELKLLAAVLKVPS